MGGPPASLGDPRVLKGAVVQCVPCMCSAGAYTCIHRKSPDFRLLIFCYNFGRSQILKNHRTIQFVGLPFEKPPQRKEYSTCVLG